MPHYIAGYDEIYDEAFQMELPAHLVEKVKQAGGDVRNIPFPDLPIKSRFRSVRHPEWNK